jgi:hypothetical protein
MRSIEPLIVTLALVMGAVIVFAVVGDVATDPIRSFRRIALTVLFASLVPNVVAGMSWGPDSWPPAIALAMMHVVAWAVTVLMLTRLAVAPRQDDDLSSASMERPRPT